MNVTEDTRQHIELVSKYLHFVARELYKRAIHHDESKFQSPEKEMYEIYRPRLDAEVLGSEENKRTLREMGEGLQHHYRANRHHPEHFPDGITEMTLIDLLEMLCDWKAAAERKGESVNLSWAYDRFRIDGQLLRIIQNTLAELE